MEQKREDYPQGIIRGLEEHTTTELEKIMVYNTDYTQKDAESINRAKAGC